MNKPLQRPNNSTDRMDQALLLALTQALKICENENMKHARA